MAEDVVTIYCCGTAFSRNRTDEAIAYTRTVTKGDRVWINDGPGSDVPILKTEQIVKAVEQGKKVPDKKFESTRGAVGGQIGGTGTQDNIVTTLQWLWMEFYRKDKPKVRTINLAGWSRGAVTCIMLAHAIEEAGFRKLNPTLKVNVFVFDPVPGGKNDFSVKGTFAQTGRTGSTDTLPSIVNEYSAVLMENVSGWLGLKPGLFKCVSPRISPTEIPPDGGAGGGPTKIEYPLPGAHADCVMFRTANNPVGQIGIHLLHAFLKRNGTELQDDWTFPDFILLEWYALARLKYVSDKRSYSKQGAQKVRAKLVVNERRDDLFFVNGHHYKLFKNTFPQASIQMKRFGSLTDDMMTKVRSCCPNTYDALGKTGVAA